MKNQTRVLLLIAALFVTTWVSAQQMQMKSPQERAQKQTMWMQKNLGLTEEQNKQVYNINLKYAQQVDEARAGAAGAEKKMEVRDLQKDKEAELKGVLTGDQFQKYQARQQEMKDRRQERRANMLNGSN